MAKDDAFGHCLSILREADRDRYAATLYLPQVPRRAAAAILAFNAEIAAIPDRVSEPLPGEIRLQWWREVLEGRREAAENPVAAALLETIRLHEIDAGVLVNLLEARIFDLYHDPMPDRAALEAYCGETGSVLLQMIAIAAGTARNAALADACGHGGVTLRMSELLRRAPLDHRRGKCPFPADLLAAAGLSVEQWLREQPDARHANAIGAFAILARQHLAKAQAAIAGLDRLAHPVFLPLATVPLWIAAAEKAGENLLATGMGVSPLRRQWALARAAMSGL